jgi:hypothetical protein
MSAVAASAVHVDVSSHPREMLEELLRFRRTADRRILDAFKQLVETDVADMKPAEIARWAAAVERVGKIVDRLVAERQKELAASASDRPSKARQTAPVSAAPLTAADPPKSSAPSEAFLRTANRTTSDRVAAPQDSRPTSDPHVQDFRAPFARDCPESAGGLSEQEFAAEMRLVLDRIQPNGRSRVASA